MQSEKQRRRRDLKDFETQYLQTGGRRLQADDRRLMDAEYAEYKVNYWLIDWFIGLLMLCWFLLMFSLNIMIDFMDFCLYFW